MMPRRHFDTDPARSAAPAVALGIAALAACTTPSRAGDASPLAPGDARPRVCAVTPHSPDDSAPSPPRSATPAGAPGQSRSPPWRVLHPAPRHAAPPTTALPRAGAAHAPDSADDTRGLDVRASFEHALQIRRSSSDLPRELRDGDPVVSGDRIRVVVKTSVDAYLYLAFCEHHSLTAYPSPRGIRTRADEPTFIPSVSDFVVDDEPGPEVLYIIASQAELTASAPSLARVLAVQPPGGAPVACLSGLVGINAPAPAASASDPCASQPCPDRRVTPPPTNLRRQPLPRKPSPPPQASRPPPPPAAPPDPDYERNHGGISWYPAVTADSDGIAMVRYEFTHVRR